MPAISQSLPDLCSYTASENLETQVATLKITTEEINVHQKNCPSSENFIKQPTSQTLPLYTTQENSFNLKDSRSKSINGVVSYGNGSYDSLQVSPC